MLSNEPKMIIVRCL